MAQFSRVHALLGLCANKTSLVSIGNRDFGGELTLEMCNKADLFMPEFGSAGFTVSMRNQLRLYATVFNLEMDIADFAFFLEFANANFENVGDSVFLDEAHEGLGGKTHPAAKRDYASRHQKRPKSPRAHAPDQRQDALSHRRVASSVHTRGRDSEPGAGHDRHMLEATDGRVRPYASTCVRDPSDCCVRFAQCDACSGAPRDWHATLPTCPCTYEQTCPTVTRCRCGAGSKDLDCLAGSEECVAQNVCAGGWRQADYLLVTWDKARHGAKKCVEKSHGSHAQRCCYDVAGMLITRGPGAGVCMCVHVCFLACLQLCRYMMLCVLPYVCICAHVRNRWCDVAGSLIMKGFGADMRSLCGIWDTYVYVYMYICICVYIYIYIYIQFIYIYI